MHAPSLFVSKNTKNIKTSFVNVTHTHLPKVATSRSWPVLNFKHSNRTGSQQWEISAFDHAANCTKDNLCRSCLGWEKAAQGDEQEKNY